MADIFISYSREDREWVSKLADALQDEGFTVWWDWDLLVGKRYRETIETELQACKATVVVWSTHSIKSDFVRDEAEEGQQRNILVPILKESVRPPAGFRQLQTADFSTWTGGTTHAEYQRMIKGLSHLIGRAGHSAEDHADAAPAPVAAAEPPAPAPVAEPAPAPVAVAPAPVAPAPAPVAPVVQAKAPDPAPTHKSVLGSSPPPATMTAPKKGMPVIGYVAIGAVALIALVFVIMFVSAQFTPNPKPGPITVVTPPAHGTTAGGTQGTAAGGTHPATPAVTPTGGGDSGGTSGGDEAGNTHGSSSTGSGHNNGGTTTPPPSNSGDSGSGGQDEGQSH